MKQHRRIPIEEMREYLAYDPRTGKIVNKRARRGAAIGEEAGADRGHGYRKVFFFGKYYYAHRIAWALHFGEQPPAIIDHLDGNGANNAIENLRAAAHSDNLRNQKRRVDNKSGYKGVSWHVKAGKWVAVCGDTYLGLFVSKEEASAAYAVAAQGKFGEFARLA